jgi:putative Holliday junction resolvase
MNRILGIDYGVKRVGIALSDLLGITAQPFTVIEGASQQEVIKRIASIVSEQSVSRIVIGLPLNMDGSSGEISENVRAFAVQLEERLNIPVELFDERLTTMQAERMLVEEADMSREKRKHVRDKVAASLILQAYLDQKSSI